MAFHIRDDETDKIVRELAARRGVGLTEAVREAATEALARSREKPAQTRQELEVRLKALRARVAALPRLAEVPDKAFYDELWAEREPGS